MNRNRPDDVIRIRQYDHWQDEAILEERLEKTKQKLAEDEARRDAPRARGEHRTTIENASKEEVINALHKVHTKKLKKSNT